MQHTAGMQSQARVFEARTKTAARQKAEEDRAAELKQVCGVCAHSLYSQHVLFQRIHGAGQVDFKKLHGIVADHCLQEIEREQQRSLLRKLGNDPSSMREKVCYHLSFFLPHAVFPVFSRVYLAEQHFLVRTWPNSTGDAALQIVKLFERSHTRLLSQVQHWAGRCTRFHV